MAILMTYCYQLKQESISGQSQPSKSQKMYGGSKWTNLNKFKQVSSKQVWTGACGGGSHMNKIEQAHVVGVP